MSGRYFLGDSCRATADDIGRDMRMMHAAAGSIRSSLTQRPQCPVCHRLCVGPPLYRYTVSQAAAHFCPKKRNAERNIRLEACIRRLWQGEECSILRCGECDFAFGYPFVGGDEKFYTILHEQKDYPAWRWDYNVARDQVLKGKEGGRILEIGAGVGN